MFIVQDPASVQLQYYVRPEATKYVEVVEANLYAPGVEYVHYLA